MLPHRKGFMLLSLVALTAVFLFGSALQARPPVVGQVTLTQATTIDGQPVKAQTTVFSGDTLAVGEGVAILMVSSGSQIRLGSDTVASFVKEGNAITVHLEKGIVSISSSKDGLIKVTATGVEIAPEGGFKTIGHIAMLGGTQDSVSITAREGSLKITQPGSSPITVKSGSTITVKTQAAAGAPAPQGGAGGRNSLLLGVAAGASSGAVLTSVLALTKASDANDAAEAATAAANAATSAANAVGTTLDTLITDLCDEGVIPSPGAASC